MNTVDNRSSEWGVSPWHWYFINAIPKSTTIAYPLALFAIIFKPTGRIFDSKVIELLTPAMIFVGMYSLLPHKELRFIFPALPVINVCGAIGLTKMLKHFPLGKLIIAVLLVSSLTFSTGMTYVSYLNYPGGQALREFNRQYRSIQENTNSQKLKEGLVVHVDVSLDQLCFPAF